MDDELARMPCRRGVKSLGCKQVLVMAHEVRVSNRRNRAAHSKEGHPSEGPPVPLSPVPFLEEAFLKQDIYYMCEI